MTDEIESTEDKAEDAQVQTQTIDDLFEDKPAEAKAEVTETKGETETEETAKAETEDKSEAETPAAKEESVPVKALTEERKKRQAAEARLKELEAKQQAPEEKIPDPLDDPEGYKVAMENKSLKIKVSLSRDLMLSLKTDYVEKEQKFIELTKENPFLIHQMNMSQNPAKFAYETAEKHLKAEQAPIELEKAQQRIAELEAQLAEASKKPDKKSALDVPDITKATAAGKNSDKTEKLPELDDVMKGSPL